jgi:stearoyl-CoA desaturase (delta-9 desaturase)
MIGWSDLHWPWVAFALLAGLVLAIFNLYLTSSVLHRSICHRGMNYGNGLKKAACIWLWTWACIPPLTWVAAHLHHHATSDTEEDPHAPGIQGFWHVTLLTWYYVPRYVRTHYTYAEARYLKPFRGDRLLHWLDVPWVSKGNFYLQIAVSLLLGPVFAAFWIGRIVPYMLLSGFTNASGHVHGDRPYDNLGTDASGLGFRLMGYLVGGETLGHNYHHRFPNSPTFKPMGFDPGFWFATRVLRGKPVRELPVAEAAPAVPVG